MPEESKEDPVSPKKNASFWSELKRRKVMRVAITYGVVAWILIQVSATVFPQLGMPEWAPRMVTLLLLIGFPVALIIAWAFELTPDGIKTTLQYRDTVKTLQQIGEELDVRYLLEGSVRRARNRVLVTVQLIDAQTEGHF